MEKNIEENIWEIGTHFLVTFIREQFFYWIRINNSFLGYRCLANDFFHEAITISQR